ncbi:MAG: molecular chaperone TorD family protein [Raoultibacter sp.]
MMEDEAVFSVIAQCFAPVDAAEWEQITKPAKWCDFLDSARRAIQDEKSFGKQTSAISRVGKRCPLQEFLSAGEVDALFAPPTFEEKCAFASQHFVGGLPDSVMPVESLYTAWSQSLKAETPFSCQTGLYLGDSAIYMRELVERMGMEVPAGFEAYPDHLALELDLVAVMLRSGMSGQAQQFLMERFEWLTAFRMQLLRIEEDARFYIGLVDVLVGIRAQQGLVEASVDHGSTI